MNSSRLRYVWIFLAAVGVVALLALLTWWLRGFASQVLAMPMAYLLYIVKLLYRSTPQVVFWLFVIGLILTVALKSLGAADGPFPRQRDAEIYYPRRERVGFWLSQVSLAREGYTWRRNSSFARFVDFFGRLIADTLTFRDQQTVRQLEQQIEQGETDLPAPIINFLTTRRQMSSMVMSSWWQRLVLFFKNLLRFKNVDQQIDRAEDIFPTFEQDLESALEYIENQLEINYEHRNT